MPREEKLDLIAHLFPIFTYICREMRAISTIIATMLTLSAFGQVSDQLSSPPNR